MSISTILKNPANKKLITCPELLIGLAVLAAIIFGGNELLIKALSTAGTEMDTKIASSKTEVEAKKQFSETLKNLQSSGKVAPLSFMSVANPEFLSVTLFDYTQGLKQRIGINSLNLPAPHNKVTLLSLESTGKDAGATADKSTPATPPEKLDLHDIKNAPFEFTEAATLKDGKLSVYAGNYTLKAKGTYASLLALLSSVLNNSPVVSVNSLNFTLDSDAPALATYRPGANLIPPATVASVSGIEGSQGAESGSGGGTSVLSIGTSGGSAAVQEAEKPSTGSPASSVKLPPSAAPVMMTLNFRIYLKEGVATVAPASAGLGSPAMMTPPPNATANAGVAPTNPANPTMGATPPPTP